VDGSRYAAEVEEWVRMENREDVLRRPGGAAKDEGIGTE